MIDTDYLVDVLNMSINRYDTYHLCLECGEIMKLFGDHLYRDGVCQNCDEYLVWSSKLNNYVIISPGKTDKIRYHFEDDWEFIDLS